MSERIISYPELKELLPCNNSMLLVDRICVVNENKLIGLKAITLDELFFLGHFPNHPIMPGVLIVEAITQVSEVAVWQRLDPERKGDIYIKSLRKVKFRKPNMPGDRLFIEVDVVSMTADTAEIVAVVKNNSGVSCQAELTMGVREKVWNPSMPLEFNTYDKTAASEMDVAKIMEFIPHRYPFLFVDYVSKLTEDGHVTAVKNVTNSEAIFRGYNDGYRVLMGSVQPEIVAQAGCIYTLSNPASKGKIAYFMGIDSAEYFAPVLPGDQLCLEVDIPDNTKKFGKGHGSMIVDGKEVSRISMTFAIVDP
ncbi:MAG: hypothetical protein IKB16_11650 [Lentisphaeria bacterium]|nr:hypothetical protein [Lentisphaeria bacterium]